MGAIVGIVARSCLNGQTLECNIMSNHQWFVELTDTFGGEANYSWVTRHIVSAKTIRGAMVKVGRASGLSFRKVSDYGDSVRYDSRSGATCAFVESYDDTVHSQYSNVNRELA